MLKKIFFIILSLNLLTHCEYKPVYSKQNNAGLKIIINGFETVNTSSPSFLKIVRKLGGKYEIKKK